MTRLTTIVLGLTFVMSVVTMWLVILLFVTKPWDDAITSAELSEILRAEQETSSEEKEAQRVAKCESIRNLLVQEGGATIVAAELSQVLAIILENNCVLDWESP